MALILSHFRFLLTQRDLFPVGVQGGRVLSLGVQDVHATHQQLFDCIRAADVTPVEIPPEEYRYTASQIVGRERQFAHIADVFRMLGYTAVETLDFSEAESPDMVHDLNQPVPERLSERYELVFDIGVVEHVCDIFQALKNCMAMVKPGGIAMHIVPLHGWHNMTFFNFQPMFFQEVYSANGFAQTRTFINFYPQYNEWNDRPMLYREYRYGDEMIFQMPRKLTNICFFAKKSATVPEFVKPIMGFYLQYHGETSEPDHAADVLDGRWLADVKRRLPSWLLRPLLSGNRFRLQLEERILPYWLRERIWCARRRHLIRALDRRRDRQQFWI